MIFYLSLQGLFSDGSVHLQEELGIEYDEDIGVSLQSFSELNQQGKKRARSQ